MSASGGSIGYDKLRKTWWYRFDATRPGGPRYQPRKRGFKSRRDAQAAMDKHRWELSQSGPIPPALTVSEYLERRIEARSARLAPSTLERYRMTLRAWIAPSALGKTPLVDLTPAAVPTFLEEIAATHGLAPATVGACWRVVVSHLRPLVETGMLPAALLKAELPRAPRPPLRVWTPAQTRQVLEALRGDLLFAPLAVAVTTGLRAGELLALTWDDLRDGALVVERSVFWNRGRAEVKEPKTCERRRVELYPETVAILERHRIEQEERKRHFPRWRTEGLIFARPVAGGWWKPQNLSSQFQARLTLLKVPRIRWHDLRHTHASHLLAAGVPVTTVASRLGHSSPIVTWKIYAHLIPGQQHEAVRLGAAYLEGIGATGTHEDPKRAVG